MLTPIPVFVCVALALLAFAWWVITEAAGALPGRRRAIVVVALALLVGPLLLATWSGTFIAQLEHDGQESNAYRMQLLIDNGHADDVRAALVGYRHELESGTSVYLAGMNLHQVLHDRCQELRLDHRSANRLP